MSSLIPMLLVMLLAHVGKPSNSRSQMFSKTGVLKNFAILTGKNLWWSLFLIKFIIPVHYIFFYLMMIDNWYFRVIFYYCKNRPRNRKNFAINRSKLIFRYLIISLLLRFVSSSNCKEKLALNWTILISNFIKYI